MSSTILAKDTTVERLDAAMELLSTTGRGRMPKDLAEQHGWGMANVHAFIVNFLKQIYILGPSVKVSDHPDFVRYGLVWCSIINAHHREEEEWYFGMLSKAISVEMIEKEHAQFHQPLEDMQNYLISCLPPKAEWGVFRTKAPSDSPHLAFDAERLNKIIDTLVVSFVPHFCDEISYLEATKLRAFISEEEFKVMLKRVWKEVMARPLAFNIALALHVRNRYFPPAPWIVTNFLIPWVLYWPGRRMWRFAPKKAYWV
ncbi:hypothetical protein DL93DRAFT_2170771 [Clavulina sp. PMI_390]|nr:hypothetical protein DL93DRAFT_2170771 [Clavulina sp. PMI_390]